MVWRPLLQKARVMARHTEDKYERIKIQRCKSKKKEIEMPGMYV
jgi:hypothetical protein